MVIDEDQQHSMTTLLLRLSCLVGIVSKETGAASVGELNLNKLG